eukprot:1159719-Pelagomonas_calceolata.AAC.2
MCTAAHAATGPHHAREEQLSCMHASPRDSALCAAAGPHHGREEQLSCMHASPPYSALCAAAGSHHLPSVCQPTPEYAGAAFKGTLMRSCVRSKRTS